MQTGAASDIEQIPILHAVFPEMSHRDLGDRHRFISVVLTGSVNRVIKRRAPGIAQLTPLLVEGSLIEVPGIKPQIFCSLTPGTSNFKVLKAYFRSFIFLCQLIRESVR